jgi:outer membrane receptor protein involved in Fe transport
VGSVAANGATPDRRLFRSVRLCSPAAALAAFVLVPAADVLADEARADSDVPDRAGVTAAADTGNSASLEEVVVTARRRSESLSRVPAAITAFNSEQLVERSIRTDADLQLAAPGLTIRETQGNNSLTYSIRGQTADTFSGSGPGSGLSAALFGKNLLDRGHFVGGMTLAAALGHNAADVGEPRTYGLEVSYRY